MTHDDTLLPAWTAPETETLKIEKLRDVADLDVAYTCSFCMMSVDF